jgi:hypothetical protein
MPHDEWTKSLADGRVAKYVYDEVAGVCSVSIVIGEYVKSHSNLEGPLTREQVEALFDREIRRAKGAP